MDATGEVVMRDAAALRTLGGDIFIRAGVPADIAAIVAADLVDANLTGHDSHGVIRIPEYVAAIRAGAIRPDGRPVVEVDRGATALVSGEWGFGQVAGQVATTLGVERAREYGVAAVALVRCNHLGRLGAFVEQAAAAGCIGMVWVGGIGGAHQAVPFGGARPAYGANPLAAGFPAGTAGPLVVDFATTAVAGGKVMVAYDRGEPLPPGSIVDKAGRATTDPAALVEGGAMLPFGGHKGYALAVLIELLGQALTGADGTGEDGFGGAAFARSGALFVAVDAGAFRPAANTVDRAGSILARIRSIPPADGFSAVQIPGDPEATSRASRENSGIPLPAKTWQAITTVAEELGIDPDAIDVASAGP